MRLKPLFIALACAFLASSLHAAKNIERKGEIIRPFQLSLFDKLPEAEHIASPGIPLTESDLGSGSPEKPAKAGVGNANSKPTFELYERGDSLRQALAMHAAGFDLGPPLKEMVEEYYARQGRATAIRYTTKDHRDNRTLEEIEVPQPAETQTAITPEKPLKSGALERKLLHMKGRSADTLFDGTAQKNPSTVTAPKIEDQPEQNERPQKRRTKRRNYAALDAKFASGLDPMFSKSIGTYKDHTNDKRIALGMIHRGLYFPTKEFIPTSDINIPELKKKRNKGLRTEDKVLIPYDKIDVAYLQSIGVLGLWTESNNFVLLTEINNARVRENNPKGLRTDDSFFIPLKFIKIEDLQKMGFHRLWRNGRKLVPFEEMDFDNAKTISRIGKVFEKTHRAFIERQAQLFEKMVLESGIRPGYDPNDAAATRQARQILAGFYPALHDVDINNTDARAIADLFEKTGRRFASEIFGPK